MKKDSVLNPFADRLTAFVTRLRRRHLTVAIVCGEANQKGLFGFGCDNGRLCVPSDGSDPVFYTDFRYIPEARRKTPWMKVRSLSRFTADVSGLLRGGRHKVGYEGSITASKFLELKKLFRRAEFVDVGKELLLLRAVKTPHEIAKITAAVALNDRVWREVRREIKPGMTEKEIQRIIRAWMNALGDGEAFETIVCAGANAAECHHVPDDTVWRRGDSLLVDMGVKLDGYCSDMTRCIRGTAGRKNGIPSRYDEIYALVLSANRAAIAAARPGITGKELDAVARRVIAKAGYGKLFGHGLGHGVGLEIHEYPVLSKRFTTALKPGMFVTIEPGIYIEGELGVRIEDLVLITKDGCEVISQSPR